MVSAEVFYTTLAFLIAAGALNIFQYVTICGLQDRLDDAENALDQRRKEADHLHRALRTTGVILKPVRPSDPLFDAIDKARRGQTQPVDHVHAAVMAGHTGMMAEAMRQRVDEQRRLEKSKHVRNEEAVIARNTSRTQQRLDASLDVDSYSHMQATQEPAPMRRHYIGNNDCTPVDHSPPSYHSHSTSSQDHASFSCDTSSSSSDSTPSSSSSD